MQTPDLPSGSSPSTSSWGPVPLPVRTALVDLIHLALLKLASAPPVGDGDGEAAGHLAALDSLARHQHLPDLPQGEDELYLTLV